MLIDLSQAVGSYLHEVFVARFQWWVLLGYVGADHVHHALRGAVDRLRACGKNGDADRLLVLLDRRRSCCCWPMRLYIRDPVFILGQGFGVFVYVAQSLFRVARPQSGGALDRRQAAGLRARRLLRSLRRRERGKAALEIADQVVDVLEADVKAHRRSARRPLRWRCGYACSRRGWRGFRSRPTTRPSRTGAVRPGTRARQCQRPA